MIFYIGTWEKDKDPAKLMVFSAEGGDSRCIQTLTLPGNFSTLKLDAEKNRLYVLTNRDPDIQEGCGGVLNVYAVQPEGTVELVQKTSSYGAEPIDLAVWKDRIALVNHGSTTNRVCRTERQADGRLKPIWVYDEASLILLERLENGNAGGLLDQYRFVGQGDVPFFQESAAPHSIFYSARGELLLVPERGSDRLSLFSVRSGRLELVGQLPEKKRCGPRNAAMTRDGRHIYMADEIVPSITHYAGPEWRAVSRVPTVSGEKAEACAGDPRSFAAPHPVALWLSQDERQVYSLTRSTETLSVFSRDDRTGELTMRQEWVLSGANPRQAMADGNRVYVVLMDAQKLVELVLDPAQGLVLRERTLLDGIARIAAVDAMKRRSDDCG